ncbi:LOW QUALITY PROTEIN: pre-mRNA-splicing factor CWC25 homolog [Denticeps clupeoides]|uniref:LOW QUALITY PROTEIN: pre-mRNA-splicing factor CWC25 homolog n=1 Tax=Denticeps clupeoides TaxID=299321 RepID=UPI0010A53B1B|nr:LOW QUALITY PROTEIN: pre-mRNA-splicing factor CWC25 homolog [Denticeps clupeoides]
MGGGDLNLKKSWHPQTLKNIERVWKVEQKHEAERKKIEELQKELRAERAREEITRYAQETGALKKKDDRLDWMYQGPSGQVSRDEYLLGRPVDKQITQQYEEPESGPSSDTGLLPGSIFNPNVAASSLDMAAKIREDPLFEIRKREEEKKRGVLTNPVKMKKIKEMLRHNLEKEKKKKKQKERKKEKHRHKDKHRRRNSEEDEPRERSRSNGVGPLKSRSPFKSGYGLQLPVCRTQNHSRDRSRSPLSHRSQRNEPEKRSQHRPATSPKPPERYHRPHNTNRTKGLSAEDLEKKRRQMIDFAREREGERESNVKKYKQQDEEDKALESKHGRHASFIHEMKLESAATSSLEDRVKRNIHSIQRTAVSLEKNFMKR